MVIRVLPMILLVELTVLQQHNYIVTMVFRLSDKYIERQRLYVLWVFGYNWY